MAHVEATTLNGTSDAEKESKNSQIIKFTLYALEGLILMASNFTILATIAKHRILRTRKEYIIVGGLCLTDGVNGLATFLAGIGRILLLIADGEVKKVSRWVCFWKPWNLIWVWNDPLSGLMLLVISIDRLLAVSMPYRYFKFGRRYGYCLVGFVYVWMWASSIPGMILASAYRYPEWPEICITSWAFPKWYYTGYNLPIKIWGGVLSVLTYGAVVIVTMIRRKPTQVNPDRNTKSSTEVAYLRQQRRLTTTLGLSSLFTLFLFVIPTSIELYVSYFTWSAAAITQFVPYTFILNNLNPMANFFLYTLRHREIRLGVKCLFTGKPLTAVMVSTGQSLVATPSRKDLADVLHMEDVSGS